MKLDARQLAGASEVRGDVAVVGAGPAGIVIARELARQGLEVVLLEGGGETKAEAWTPTEVITEDPFHVSMALATRHQVGGASHLWGGRCVPFDPIDFESRDFLPQARWPVRYEDVASYLPRACHWAVCGEATFDATEIRELAGRTLVPGLTDGAVRATSLERWSLPTNFAREYGAELHRDRRIRLITNLTCTAVRCREDGRAVDYLEGRTPELAPVRIRAQMYVLACGGLETTRLLFASDGVHPGGIGNHAGHLGRWYMGHVESRIAEVHFTTPPDQTIFGYERDRDGVYVRRRFTFAADFLRQEGLSNCAMWLINPSVADPAHGSGILSFVYLMLSSPLGGRFVAEGIRQYHIAGAKPGSRPVHLRNVRRELAPALAFALRFAYQRYLKRGRKVPGFFVPSQDNVYCLDYHGEHLPDRESYVEPSRERDRFGLPRLRTHLRLGEADVDNDLRAHRYLDEYLREQGVGHLEYRFDDLRRTVADQFFGGYHQAGTTRMSERPADGVVDANLAVHGLPDLHVASSSTFVTSSQANSTLMLLAFALRLADHLGAELRGRYPTSVSNPAAATSRARVSPSGVPTSITGSDSA